jgi:hypothetical protein
MPGSHDLHKRQHWAAIAKALKPVYTAPTEAAAMERFTEFTEESGASVTRRSSGCGTTPGPSSFHSGLRSRDPPGDLLDQRHRVRERPDPPRGQGSRHVV